MVVESVAAQGAFAAAGGENDLRFMAAFEATAGAGGVLTEIVPLVSCNFALDQHSAHSFVRGDYIEKSFLLSCVCPYCHR